MSHIEPLTIDVDRLIEEAPIKVSGSLSRLMWACVATGAFTFLMGMLLDDPAHVWAVFYINLLYWMGIAAGAVMIPVIFQIVRAAWSPPVRRIAEANVAFLPWAYFLFLSTYLGKEYLFPWARSPMPGREWWMSPDFVYARFSLLLLLLFFVMWRFVGMSLRGDIGLIREKAKNGHKWSAWIYDYLTRGWQGTEKEVSVLQPKMSWNGPLIVILYAIIYSLFAFEMVMGMDTIWYSNMFGGFAFIGNIYMGWATLSLLVIYFTRINPEYRKCVGNQQFWDLGKLTLGFGILWAYLFFSQFLPQWYGNLPEETQWLILRTREYPWKAIGWLTLSMCFVFPFIMLLSRDLKKTPSAFGTVCLIIMLGMWCEKYVIVMPQFTPGYVPFNFVELGLFLGFLGIYVLSILSFIQKFPFVPLSHPLTKGSTDW